jgi:hypothetical protein
MTGVLASLRTRRTRLLRFVAVLLLAAEAVGIVVAPSAEAVASRSAPAHVEAGGTHLHHSHIPETCPACVALQINGIPSRPDAPELPGAEEHEPLPFFAPTWLTSRGSRSDPKTPRAPPLILAVR